MMVVKTFYILAFVIIARLIPALQQRDLVNGSYSTLKLNLSDSTRDNSTDGNFNTTATFKVTGCNKQQQYQLNLATQDMLDLALTVFSKSELKRDENVSIVARQQISFKTQAAMDYFGPYSQNGIYQASITGNSPLILLFAETVFMTDVLKDVFINMARSGGWGDWWYDRRVILTCEDVKSDCNKPGNGGLAAYYYKPAPQDPVYYYYPTIVFCPLYFDGYLPHPIVWSYLKQHKEFQNNVLNLLSQGASPFEDISTSSANRSRSSGNYVS